MTSFILINLLKDRNNAMITIYYTILHFVVDGLCSYIIFTNKYDNFLLAFCVYNFLAFILQPFIGLLIDRNKNHKLFLLIASLFIVAGYIFRSSGYITLALHGIGNAFFHIAGGYEVIKASNNDIRHLGVFVSTGVIGLTVAKLYNTQILGIILLILLCIIDILILLIKEEKAENKISFERENIEYKFNRIDLVLVVFSILIVVFIRSFMGITLKFDTNSRIALLLISIFVAFGKASGGYIYNLLGCKKTVIISFVITTISLFFVNNIYIYLLLLFLFNISMPITLYFINIVFKNESGFAFGLLASVLVPGYMCGLIFPDTVYFKLIFIILNLISMSLINFSYNTIKKNHV